MQGEGKSNGVTASAIVHAAETLVNVIENGIRTWSSILERLNITL